MWSSIVSRLNKQAGKFKRSVVKRGRVAALLQSVPDDAVILEIGGSYNPRIQPIDFVFDGRPIEELIPPTLRFDLIYGSHVLEHQVDLIGHLQSLEKLLKPGAA